MRKRKWADFMRICFVLLEKSSKDSPFEEFETAQAGSFQFVSCASHPAFSSPSPAGWTSA